MERKGLLQPGRKGVEVIVFRYLSVSGEGMLRGAVPDNGCVVRATAARVEIVSVGGA